MALQNIGAANSDDAFYRYKMPRMITKIEGRGNGIKTNIVNMVDIAKALARPASYTTKYFGCELGAQSKFDEKTGTSLVNGAHDTAKLAGLLENFIKKYVQCYGCGNPETEVIITRTQMVHLKCAACGYVSEADMRDKLTTFILKNPPEAKKGSKDKKAMRRAEKERLKEGEAADEEQKKVKKEMKKKGGKEAAASKTRKKTNALDEERTSPPRSQAAGDVAPALDEDDSDVQWQTDTSMAAARQRITEQLNAVTAEMVMLSSTEMEEKPKGGNGAAVNGSHTEKPKGGSSAAVNGSHTEKPKGGSSAAVNGSHTEKPKGGNVAAVNGSNTEEMGTNDNRDRILKEIKNNLKKGTTPARLASFSKTLDADPDEVMHALFEALFEGIGKGFAKEVGKKKSYLAAMVKDEASQLHLLSAIAAFCEKSGPDASREVPLVAKVLYDNDVLEEENILQWYREGVAGNNKAAAVWKNVKPFIEWLESAESESEEE